MSIEGDLNLGIGGLVQLLSRNDFEKAVGYLNGWQQQVAGFYDQDEDKFVRFKVKPVVFDNTRSGAQIVDLKERVRPELEHIKSELEKLCQIHYLSEEGKEQKFAGYEKLLEDLEVNLIRGRIKEIGETVEKSINTYLYYRELYRTGRFKSWIKHKYEKISRDIPEAPKEHFVYCRKYEWERTEKLEGLRTELRGICGELSTLHAKLLNGRKVEFTCHTLGEYTALILENKGLCVQPLRGMNIKLTGTFVGPDGEKPIEEMPRGNSPWELRIRDTYIEGYSLRVVITSPNVGPYRVKSLAAEAIYCQDGSGQVSQVKQIISDFSNLPP